MDERKETVVDLRLTSKIPTFSYCSLLELNNDQKIWL